MQDLVNGRPDLEFDHAGVVFLLEDMRRSLERGRRGDAKGGESLQASLSQPRPLQTISAPAPAAAPMAPPPRPARAVNPEPDIEFNPVFFTDPALLPAVRDFFGVSSHSQHDVQNQNALDYAPYEGLTPFGPFEDDLATWQKLFKEMDDMGVTAEKAGVSDDGAGKDGKTDADRVKEMNDLGNSEDVNLPYLPLALLQDDDTVQREERGVQGQGQERLTYMPPALLQGGETVQREKGGVQGQGQGQGQGQEQGG